MAIQSRRVSFIIAICTGILALLNLTLGWGAGIEFLVRIRADYPAMVPSTAVCLFLGSIGMLCLPVARLRWAGLGCGLLIVIVVLAHHQLTIFDLGADDMSIGTALACLLIAFCLFVKSFPEFAKTARLIPETLGVSIALIPTLGYVFNAEALFSNPVYTQMALHTAIGFVSLFVGFLMYDAQIGWMKVIVAPDLGSQMLRKLLPIVTIGPVVLTGLALIASRNDYLSPDLRAAMLSYVMIVVILTASIYFAHLTNLSERRAAQADRLRRESDRGRQVAEVALERGQKVEALGKLVGGVAHDFNNMLTVILGNLELLQVVNDKKSQNIYVNEALEAVEQSTQLTRQLLAYGRKSRLEPTPSVLDELIQQTLKMFERLCPANITVTTRLATPGLIVQLDQVNFQQALLNVLINAQDAQPGGGEIIISTAAQQLGRETVSGFGGPEKLFSGSFVSVTISDIGPGMTAQELSRATEPFFTTKPIGKGTGLGLSVASGFCRQSGGGLTLSSAPGVGLTVSMVFPQSDQQQTKGADQELPAPRQTVSNRLILLVDDDPKVTRVMSRQLQLDGNDVQVALNADEALTIIENGPVPDLVLTDVVMPGQMQGHALAKEIRARFPTTHVILMSGYNSMREHRADAEGWDEPFLQKPVNWTVLREVVASVLSQPSDTEPRD